MGLSFLKAEGERGTQVHRAGLEMAQLAERLLCKHEDPVSDHQNHVKSRERQQESETPVLWEQG